MRILPDSECVVELCQILQIHHPKSGNLSSTKTINKETLLLRNNEILLAFFAKSLVQSMVLINGEKSDINGGKSEFQLQCPFEFMLFHQG